MVRGCHIPPRFIYETGLSYFLQHLKLKKKKNLYMEKNFKHKQLSSKKCCKSVKQAKFKKKFKKTSINFNLFF